MKRVQIVVVEKVNVKEVKKEGMITKKRKEMELNEGREASEDGRGKGGKTIVPKPQRKKGK